ncbi:MAG: iron-sulfur cluster assembly accessory protein [archaeon]
MITKDTLIGEVVDKFPAAVDILLEEGVHCVGCGAANFESVEQGLEVHGKTKEEIADVVKRMNVAVKEAEKNKDTITITKIAAEKVKEIMKKDKKQGQHLRISISESCCGAEYGLEFVKEENKDDKVFVVEGVKFLVDKKSFALMKGSKVDFIDNIQGTGFKITNPNEKSGCACDDSSC